MAIFLLKLYMVQETAINNKKTCTFCKEEQRSYSLFDEIAFKLLIVLLTSSVARDCNERYAEEENKLRHVAYDRL